MPDLVGKVFYDSWGYDQTNIDFVKVIATTPSGKTAICQMMHKRRVTNETVEPTEPYGVTFRLKVAEYNGQPELVGTYPFVQGEGVSGGTRFGSFWLYEGKPVYETPDGMGH